LQQYQPGDIDMLCQDTAGELPAIHISSEAFHVAQEYDAFRDIAIQQQLPEWSVTFRNLHGSMASAKFEFTKFLQKLKKHLVN